MLDENIVRDLFVSDGSRAVKASYFVGAGILHASVDGRNLVLPVGVEGSEEAVRRLIIGQMQTKKWRERIAARWQNWQLGR